MSKEKSSSPDSSQAASTDEAGKRRAPKSRQGKSAKPATAEQPAAEEPVARKSPVPYPVFDSAESATSGDSPEPALSGDPSPQEKAKRKRRRKKGKGGATPNAAQSVPVDVSAEAAEESTAGEAAAPVRPAARQAQPKLDPDKVNKLALKIYLAEVSEEGVALIGDSDAKELSRRCFRLAEIFIEEQSRRR